MAANRQTDIHTHVCNAVMLVWGSLRLAPISGSSLKHCNGLLCGCVGVGKRGGWEGGWEGLKLKVASYAVLTL